MLIQEGDARSGAKNLSLARTLAAVAGALNTAAFQAVGFFSANMTGNVSSLSEHLAFGDLVVGFAYFAIVAAFVGGALVSTLLINAGRRRGIRTIYAYSILTEACCLACLGVADLLFSVNSSGPFFVIGLSFLMGLQNAAVTRISGAHVRTTHVSGMSTDIGIELGMLLDIFRGLEPEADAAAYRAKLRLHGQTVLAFFLGGVIGALVYRAASSVLLIGSAGVLASVAIPGIIATRREA